MALTDVAPAEGPSPHTPMKQMFYHLAAAQQLLTFLQRTLLIQSATFLAEFLSYFEDVFKYCAKYSVAENELFNSEVIILKPEKMSLHTLSSEITFVKMYFQKFWRQGNRMSYTHDRRGLKKKKAKTADLKTATFFISYLTGACSSIGNKDIWQQK